METRKIAAPLVLVVDDDEDLVHMIDLKLKRERYRTLVSLNGENVRELITHCNPDIVLLDIHMQGVDGGEICKDIKTDPKTSSITVILFSANANIRTIMNECGADGFITKPLESNILVRTIEHFLLKKVHDA